MSATNLPCLSSSPALKFTASASVIIVAYVSPLLVLLFNLFFDKDAPVCNNFPCQDFVRSFVLLPLNIVYLCSLGSPVPAVPLHGSFRHIARQSGSPVSSFHSLGHFASLFLKLYTNFNPKMCSLLIIPN